MNDSGIKEKNLIQEFIWADILGKNAIVRKYEELFQEYENDYEGITKLSFILGYKSFEWKSHNKKYSKLYTELRKKVHEYACNNFVGEELEFYLSYNEL